MKKSDHFAIMHNAAVLLQGFLVGLAAAAFAAPPAERGVILISIDGLRSDRIGARRNGMPLTPHLDRLAYSGAWFRNAVAASPWTLPSMGTVLTGLLPSGHELTNRFASFGENTSTISRLSPRVRTLAEAFRDAGFETAAFTGDAGLDREFGFDRGFSVYFDSIPFAGFETTAPLALEWLRERGGRPFFLFLHGYDVHARYRGSPLHEPVLGETLGADDLRAWYDSRVVSADKRVGSFLEMAAKIPAISTSVVIAVMSDHGEELLERGGSGHGKTLYDEALKTVLIFAGPGVVPRVIDDQVRMMDLPLTLLDFAGVSDPAFSRQARGVSLRPFINGGSMLLDARSETDFLYQAAKRSYRSADGRKLILDLETLEREVFDLRSDPGELKNLIHEAPAWAADFENRLRENPREVGRSLPMSGGCELFASSASDGNPQSEGFLAAQAMERISDGKIKEALELSCRAVRAGNGTESAAALAKTLEASGEADRALGVLREALIRHPDSADLHLNLGKTMQNLGRFEEAIHFFQRAKFLAPENAHVYSVLGYARELVGDEVGASAEFESAVAVSSGDALSRHHFAAGLARQGRSEEAVREFEKVLHGLKGPGDESSYAHGAVWLAGILMKIGAPADRVISVYREAIAKTRAGEALWFAGALGLTDALIEMKRVVEAQDELGRLLEFCARQGCPMAWTARIHQTEFALASYSGKDAAAKAALEKALHAVEKSVCFDLPECSRIVRVSGVLAREFDGKSQRQFFERAVRAGLQGCRGVSLGRTAADFHWMLGEIRLRQGLFDEARKSLYLARGIFGRLGVRDKIQAVDLLLKTLSSETIRTSPFAAAAALVGIRYSGKIPYQDVKTAELSLGQSRRISAESADAKLRVFSQAVPDESAAQRLLGEWRERFLGLFEGDAAYSGMLTRAFAAEPEMRPRLLAGSVDSARSWIAPASRGFLFGVGAKDLVRNMGIVSHRWCPGSRTVFRLELFFPIESFDEGRAVSEMREFSCAADPGG